ncbi:PREDICTED: uncharacterized protein LOC105133990 isoform X5 [Populus euphratica]|uniref:DNA N(6)-methyladenine demethylase n=1 Tax=Populus euphratica TaxID=75702 RepID=A0AAJ6UV58_POPEU|nr:PREDICTED: uncharacterized protein LOC105133990 isoform X5 [Populus euphratica]
MNRDPGRGRDLGRGRGRGRGRDLGRGRGRDRGRGHWRSPGGSEQWVPKGRSSDPSSHSNYSVGADESSDDEKPFSNRGRNSQPNSRGWFPSYPNSAGNIFCQKEPLENKSLEDSMSSTGRILHDQSAPSCSSIGSNQSDCSVASNSVNKGDSALMPAISGSRDMKSDIVSTPLEKGAKDGAVDFSLKFNSTIPLQNQNESHLSFQAVANGQLSQEKDPNIVVSAGYSGYSEQRAVVEPFDICLPKTGTTLKLKPSLLVKNREKRNDVRRAAGGVNGQILRSGMVLLKNYLSLHDQIKIIKLCRDIGLGPGGFYQPVYRDGGRMHLKMMSLGRSWDPDRGEYVEHRPVDGAKAPIFPSEFHPLVDRAIKDSHALIEINCKSTAAKDILPSLSPNICVVNFYSESGRLGLHQDKDESQESLRKGLPVVSFSIGDTGEFLYGDQRDVEKAEKISLVSGDVLIFGGMSRHIFHGVSSVQPKTAPAALLDETNLRSGRLNLTFREY